MGCISMFAQSRKGGGRAEGEAEGEDGAETNIHKRKKTKDVYWMGGRVGGRIGESMGITGGKTGGRTGRTAGRHH